MISLQLILYKVGQIDTKDGANSGLLKISLQFILSKWVRCQSGFFKRSVFNRFRLVELKYTENIHKTSLCTQPWHLAPNWALNVHGVINPYITENAVSCFHLIGKLGFAVLDFLVLILFMLKYLFFLFFIEIISSLHIFTLL